MWNRNIPRNHFWTANYPNLDPNAEGQVMALSWGTIKNLVPVCRDTVALVYQFNDGAVKAIDKVVADGVELEGGGIGYTDQGDGSIILGGTPKLEPDTDYFLVIESDYPINGDAYNIIACSDPWGAETYDTHPESGVIYLGWWEQDELGVWTDAGGTKSINLYIRGSATVGGPSNRWLTFPMDDFSLKEQTYTVELRDTVAHTRIAQKFHTKASWSTVCYVNKVKLEMKKHSDHGNYLPDTRITKVYFMSVSGVDGSPDAQIGIKSDPMPFRVHTGGTAVFPQKGAPSEIRVDFRGRTKAGDVLIETVADFVSDAYVNVLKGKLADLGDLTDLQTLPQVLAIPLEEEIAFGSLIDKLTAGQNFQMVSNLDGTFKFKVFVAGEPAGVLELFDEDMHEFKSYRKSSGCVFGRVRVGYDKDLTLGEFKFAEALSDIAPLVYKNEETLLFETYLSSAVDAQALAVARLTYVEASARIISFFLSGAKGYDLTPGDKIKVYRTRADYAGGSLNGILFRVLSISPALSSDTLSVVAQLDSQTCT